MVEYLGDCIIAFFVVMLALLTEVESKYCTYVFETGYPKNFYCSPYEYCCGAMCCRSRAITFYQLWYFWLMVILMLLLCSGGGWWYRFRYRTHFNGQSRVVIHPPNATQQRRAYIYGAGTYHPAPTATQGSPPPYTTVNQIPPQPYSQAGVVSSAPLGPPPPYTGPPPSYSTVTGQVN